MGAMLVEILAARDAVSVPVEDADVREPEDGAEATGWPEVGDACVLLSGSEADVVCGVVEAAEEIGCVEDGVFEVRGFDVGAGLVAALDVSGSGLGLTTRYVAVAVTVFCWFCVTVVAEIAVIVVAISSVIV